MMASCTVEDGISMATGSLLNLESERTPLELLNDKLKAVQKHFVWLEEITEEIEKKISEKSSSVFNTFPKTPSIKQRAQARARLDAIQESDNDTPQQEFEPKKKKIVEESVEVIDSPKGRPQRRTTRQRTATAAASSTTRTTRGSKKPTISFSTAVASEQEDHTTASVTVPPVDCKDDSENLSKARVPTCFIPLKDENENKSPSVKDRAKAYETMLNKNQNSVSPAKTHILTPNSAGRNFASATISSLAKSSPRLVICDKQSPSSNSSPSPAKFTHKLPLRRSKRSSATQYTTPPVKPTRTKKKLALKKKSIEPSVPQAEKCDKQKELSTEVTDERKSVLSRDSALSSASSFSQYGSCEEDEDRTNSSSKKSINVEKDEGLDETHVIITEVYNLEADGQEELVEYDKVQTKNIAIPTDESTTSVSADSSTSSPKAGVNTTFTKDSPPPAEAAPVRTTRTRTRAIQEKVCNDVKEPVALCSNKSSSDSLFTDLKQRDSEEMMDTATKPEEEPVVKSTRTRTRGQNKQDSMDVQEEPSGGIRTRTRQRLAETNKNDSESSVRDVSVVSNAAQPTVEDEGQMRTTRSRVRKAGVEDIPSGTHDEVLAGSPAIKVNKKRPVQEYGNSPHPKRSRSYAGLPEGGDSTFNMQSILLTSSPTKGNFDGTETQECDDTLDCLMSPGKQYSKPYIFSSAQRSMFMKRTPSFVRTNSKLYSFMGNSTPTQNGGVLTSFLKRNTPSKPNIHNLQQQKIQRLQEKEKLETERLKKAAKLKKQKMEEQKRLRDDRLRRVAEARDKRLREELEMKEKINKKFEDKASLKERMLEEKLKVEHEKKGMRARKMLEAETRRRQEEEDRARKRVEQEEEAKRQQEWMQRKKEYEEEERKRHIEEEKRKQEERLQKMQEDKVRQKRLEEEKKERLRKEREKQLALEKAEKERADQEKREERERRYEEQRRKEELKRLEELRRQEELRLQEEKRKAEEIKRLEEKRKADEEERIKAMKLSQQKAREAALQMQKEREAKKLELQKLIQQSKSNLITPSTGTNGSVGSFLITPDAKKVYRPYNPDNYDIEDMGSEDSTDDESAPKKKIPEWSMKVPLHTALIRQYHNPPDLDKLFRPHLVGPPDLAKLFPTSRQRHKFKYRTSSAIWTSPLMKK